MGPMKGIRESEKKLIIEFLDKMDRVFELHFKFCNKFKSHNLERVLVQQMDLKSRKSNSYTVKT